MSRPRRREISGSLAEAVPFALLVFGCLGVPLISAATPHLAQRFRSIIEAFPFVNTLSGNWLTNFQIGRLNLVFSLVNPLVVAYMPLDTLSYPFLTPIFKLILNFVRPLLGPGWGWPLWPSLTMVNFSVSVMTPPAGRSLPPPPGASHLPRWVAPSHWPIGCTRCDALQKVRRTKRQQKTRQVVIPARF